MTTAYFITATDTDAGKTTIGCGLLQQANRQNMTTLGIKPIAAGCIANNGRLQNPDALAIMHSSSIKLTYEEVNPVALEPAIAPHIALKLIKKACYSKQLADYCQTILLKKADFAIIEGAGGWRVPLNENEFFSDLVKHLDIPIILVVGMKLGCINHALLTYEAINNDGLKVIGWVANKVDKNMQHYQENFKTLLQYIDAPCLGEVPYIDDICYDKVASYLHLQCV